MSSNGINLLNFKDQKIFMLHITWVAFFLTFVVWFSHAPLMMVMAEAMSLSTQQIKALLILNVALTIPARIVIGMLVDRFGPRNVFTGLLMVSGVICVGFSMSTTFNQLAILRFMLGLVGAGFVIGIRLVGEWFPAKQVGLAEGVYGGWGNFGSAAAALTLPSIAMAIDPENGWRWAIGGTGVVAFLYGIFYYVFARNTPKGSTYFKPKKSGGLEVTSKGDFIFLLAMNVPMYIALSVLVWKLSPTNLGMLSQTASLSLYGGFVCLFIFQSWQIFKVNEEMLKHGVPELDRYPFKQVAILNWSYFATFGSELAVVSMLPLFFTETFNLSPVTAGMMASGFAFMNLVARPGGGWLSDRFGRRKTLLILMGGLTLGYLVMSRIDSAWPAVVAMVACMCCSFFVQAGEGAVFAMVPLVKRRMTGQIAGMTGAYGNVGAVVYLTVLSFVNYSTFFMIIAISSACIAIVVNFLEEPAGHTAEVMEDGTVQFIKVS